MSQQLTVQYELKSFKVKTTPSMSLKDVLDKSLVHFKLDPTDGNYSLLRGKSEVSLMMPMRLANLPQGCNLTLVVKKGSTATTSSMVNIKLQVNDSTVTQPLVLQIDSLKSVLDMLKIFEETYKLELLNKTELITQKHMGYNQIIKVEYTPKLQIFTTIISSEQDLKRSLSSYGIISGNVVIRFNYQLANQTVESEEKVSLERDPEEEEEVMVNERDDLNEMVDQEILIQKEKKFEDQTMEVDATPDQSLVAFDGESLTTEELAPKLFDPLKNKVVIEQEDEKSYEMSIDQAKLYHKLITNSALNARTREKLNLNKKPPVVKSVSVRIKFQDLSILELTFNKTTAVSHIHQTLNESYLIDPNLKYSLFQSYPHKLISPSDDLILDTLGLKAVLIFQSNATGAILRPDIELSTLTYTYTEKDSGDEEIVTPQTVTPVHQISTQDESAPKVKKVPKWLKLGKK